MTLKRWTVAEAPVLLPPCAAHAATEANFTAGTVRNLEELCTATPDTAIGTAAVNFCKGFVQGAFSVEMRNLVALRGPKLFWMPNPLPTRNEALSVCQMGTRLAGSHAGSIHPTGCSGF